MKNFPDYYTRLQRGMATLGTALPDTLAGFGHLHRAIMDDGALSVRVKELIALAIAVVQRCDGGIAYHLTDALREGARREEIVEAVGVAILMGGGPAMVSAAEALDALAQFEARPKSWSPSAT